MHSMNWPVKKIFLVLFAILIGASIVLFAWKGSELVSTATPDSTSPSENAVGWEKSLAVVSQDRPSKTASISLFDPVAEKDYEAKTATDIAARTILSNYAFVQSQNSATTTVSDEEAVAIAKSAITKIGIPQATQYSVKDIRISTDNSTSATESYSKSIAVILKTFAAAQTKTDIEVAFAEPKEGEEEKRLSAIAKNISNYEQLIKSLLALKTPSRFTQIHLHLLQKFANIQVLIDPLAEVYTDPIKALAALDQYRREIETLPLLTKEFRAYF